MLVRHLKTIALGGLAIAACAGPDRRSASDTRTSRTAADSAPVTTYQMSQALTRDVGESERALGAIEDSIYVFMGDSVTSALKRADSSWAQYRKLECDAVRVAFAGGTMAPLTQMECWVGLTDGRRRFLADEYDYMRSGRAAPGAPVR